MTKTTYLSAVRYAIKNLEASAPDDVLERLQALEASLVKRASAERKPTKAQREAVEARGEIVERLVAGERYTATDVGKLFDKTANWAAPKLNALVEQGVLVKTIDKRKGYYSLAE